ncbi:MAG: PTS sugar transporter subunit IIA, partial [Eubacteriales bacterium]|nr:PTS sugar transporter subunit IIA [Eubacteriales bacterium]
DACDLLVTTLDCGYLTGKEIVRITPYFTIKDKYNLQMKLDTILIERKKQVLRDYFQVFFCSSLFMIKDEPMDEVACMKEMAQKMQKEGYVYEDFYDCLLARDSAASVAFGNFAIPHSMKSNAIKTGISVLIHHTGISWHEKRVLIVFTVAINRADVELYTELFEALIEVLSDEDSLKKLADSCSYQEFTQKFLSVI